MEGVGELAPRSARVAHLTLVIGVGALGEQLAQEIDRLLAREDEGPRLAINVARAGDLVDPKAATTQLLSGKNLDRLEQLGYQIPSRRVGQPLRLNMVFAIDLTASDADAQVQRILAEIQQLGAHASATAVVLGLSREQELLSHATVTDHPWACVLPVPSQDPVAGVRSAADIVATVARVLLLVITSNQGQFGSPLLPPAAVASAETVIVRLGGSFADAGSEDLLECLANPIAGELLERQFKDVKPHDPPASFDDQRRTRTLELLSADLHAHRLFAGTPFLLVTDEGEPWRVSLPPGIISAEVEGAPRRRWVAVLLKLRDLFDFTKAHRWTESVQAAEAELLSSLNAQINEDVNQLHHYERGPDRLLAWASKAQAILEKQPDIATLASKDFSEAIQRLRDEISRAPNAVAVWARVALLGWLGAEASRYLASLWVGRAAAWGVFAFVLLIAAILGFRMLEGTHESLYSALRDAQDALVRRYEIQARENLVLVLTRVRNALLAKFNDEVDKVRNQAGTALLISASMKEDYGPTESPDLTNVEWVVPSSLRKPLLGSLAPPWRSLHVSAAGEGALAPSPAAGSDCMSQTAETLRLFAKQYLLSRCADLSLARLIEFRGELDPQFSERIIEDLDRRATSQAPRPPHQTTWHGPDGVLARFHVEIAARDQRYTEWSADSRMLACLKTETGVTTLSGGAR